VHLDCEVRVVERRIEPEVIGERAMEKRRDEQLARMTKPDGTLATRTRHSRSGSEHVAKAAPVRVVHFGNHARDLAAHVVVEEEADRVEHVARDAQVRDEARGVRRREPVARAQCVETRAELETRDAIAIANVRAWRERRRVVAIVERK
jgi:hypothetical protein